MAKKSAGILIYRWRAKELQVLLTHPGGPFWSKKDLASWSIPKGEFDESESPLMAALRELEEETGVIIDGDFIELSPVKTKSGKIIYCWAVEGDADPDQLKSNLFEMEWPPRSRKMQKFPEVDRMEWFNMVKAGKKINAGQLPILAELNQILNLN